MSRKSTATIRLLQLSALLSCSCNRLVLNSRAELLLHFEDHRQASVVWYCRALPGSDWESKTLVY